MATGTASKTPNNMASNNPELKSADNSKAANGEPAWQQAVSGRLSQAMPPPSNPNQHVLRHASSTESAVLLSN